MLIHDASMICLYLVVQGLAMEKEDSCWSEWSDSIMECIAECQKAVDLKTNAPRVVSVCADIVTSHLVGQDMGTPHRVEDNILVVTNNENDSENVTQKRI